VKSNIGESKIVFFFTGHIKCSCSQNFVCKHKGSPNIKCLDIDATYFPAFFDILKCDFHAMGAYTPRRQSGFLSDQVYSCRTCYSLFHNRVAPWSQGTMVSTFNAYAIQILIKFSGILVPWYIPIRRTHLLCNEHTFQRKHSYSDIAGHI
jgi:hypothetical protein